MRRWLGAVAALLLLALPHAGRAADAIVGKWVVDPQAWSKMYQELEAAVLAGTPDDKKDQVRGELRQEMGRIQGDQLEFTADGKAIRHTADGHDVPPAHWSKEGKGWRIDTPDKPGAPVFIATLQKGGKLVLRQQLSGAQANSPFAKFMIPLRRA